MKYKFPVYIILPLVLAGASCKKYLDTKSDQSLSTPSTFDDLRLLLDNPFMNKGLDIANTLADEYYFSYEDWLALDEIPKKAYTWDPNLDNIFDWTNQYNAAFYANTVLSNIDNIEEYDTKGQKPELRGEALFYRAASFYSLAQLFIKPFDSVSAHSDLGIPLRLDANFNKQSYRATISETFDQIIGDITSSLALLNTKPVYKTRPGKAACYGLLSRIYLQMGNYTKSKQFADEYLNIYNELIDFNQLDASADYPLPGYKSNPEICFYSSNGDAVVADDSKTIIDSTLYKLFHQNDLRSTVYFKDNSNGTYSFKGNYTGGYELFTGIATDEIYLIRAECNARLNRTPNALSDLTILLNKRYITGTYTIPNITNASEALALILQERRKELIFRGIRWSDLRRLNRESAFSVRLTRELNGNQIELKPNDLRYTLLIPREIMRLTTLPQNPR